MKKTLITLGIVAGVIATPILGMTISPTRDVILGLAPDQAVLSLADKIDEQRVSTEQTDAKIKELQSVIDNQQSEIANYQQQIDNVKSETKKSVETEISNERKKQCDSRIKKYTDKISEAKKDKKNCDDSEVKYGKGCKELAENRIKDFEKLLDKTNSECNL
jgi:TolA-binding protein